MAEPQPENGAAAVEMAFVAMLLVLLVMGVADLGRVIFTYIGIQDAAQEGAIYGSFEPSNEDAIKSRAADSIDYPSLTPADVIVTCPDGDPNAPGGSRVSVTVSHSVSLITPIVGQMFGGSIDLSRTFTGEVFLGECLT